MKVDNSRKRKKEVKDVGEVNKKKIHALKSKRTRKTNHANRSGAVTYNKFLLKMFESDVEVGVSEWLQLLKESIIVTDFNASIPHLRMFEKMISKISRIYFGSELISFFAKLITKLEAIDAPVITLMFEWCFTLYCEKKFLLKNQIRENLSYDIIKNVLTGIIGGNVRNYLIFLICCDNNISRKYFFPNSHIKDWMENTSGISNVNDLQDNIWKFSLGILENIRVENKKSNIIFKLSLVDSLCMCDANGFFDENIEIDIKFFEKICSYFDNSKLLALFVNSLYYHLPYKSKICSYFIDILLNSQIIRINNTISIDSKTKSGKKVCACYSGNCLPPSALEPYELIVYTMISLVFSYYGIKYDISSDFNVLYEESYNILHYLTENEQANSSFFFIHKSQEHIETINELLAKFGGHPILKQNISFDFFQLDCVNSFVILVFDSILSIFKSKDIRTESNTKHSKDTVIEEILVTLLFLTILHPNTTDFTIIYLLKKLYQDLYSFGFLLIGSCISLLFKKDIFPDRISKTLQLNILNFRSIHVINSYVFPYIQFFNCIYHLISRSSKNYRLVNTIFQLFEGNFLQYFDENTRNKDIDEVELHLSINISLTLNSVYLKLLEFFSLNPLLCKLFFETKFKNQVNNSHKVGLKEIKIAYNILNHSKPSLLDIFNKLSSSENDINVDNIPTTDDLKCNQSQFEISKQINLISMCYSTMIHILGIVYIPVIKRANMSIYTFNYNITPFGFLLSDFHMNNDNIYLESVSLIQKESFEIPVQFCIEFLDEILNYCKLTNQQSLFEIDRFIVTRALEATNSASNYKRISSFTHTCISDKLIPENCFSCCIDSYLEYLGIINSIKSIKGKCSNYYFSKSWVNHGTIICLITLIGGRIDAYGANRLLESEISTFIEFFDETSKFNIDSLSFELLSELIKMLLFEIKDEINIRKESGDIQRVLFRSLLIYLLNLAIKNRMLEDFILKLDLQGLIIKLCNLFAFRVECLSTNINNGYFIQEANSFSTPNKNKLPNDGDIEGEYIFGDYYSPKSTNSKNTYLSTPRIKKVTPVIISRSSQTNKSLANPDLFSSNTGTNSYIALKGENNSDSPIFHLKTILNTITTILELKLTRNANFSIVLGSGLHSTMEEFTIDILEKTLFFLLPSNTFSKGSIFNTAKIVENDSQSTYLDTICECSENSEAEEIENPNENEKINSKSHFSVGNINKQAFIPFSLNEDDFSKNWYVEIVTSLIRYLFNNINSVRDISGLITDIASKTVMWNRKDNKTIIFKVFKEILKFTFDYFYDDLAEISLCLLRNNGSQLLSSVKFVFVALLDQNSKLIDSTLIELPSIYALSELEELHEIILLFHNLSGIFDLCFEILIQKENIFSDKDDIWIKSAISFMGRGTEALNTELSKMERIIVPPKIDTVDGQFTDYSENENIYEGHDSEETWNRYINNCSSMLGECEYTIEFISMNWVSSNKDTPNNERNKSSKEIDDDLNGFITFEECDEGILLGDESYTDIKLTPHWSTFIKSLFL